MYPPLTRFRTAVSLFTLGLCLFASGCQPSFDDQPRADVMEPRAFTDVEDRLRTPVAGTVARGQIWQKTPVTTGKENGELVARIPLSVTDELVERGQQQFQIYCQHCHGDTGFGDGMVVQRGFPTPPSYHIERLHDAPDGHIFEVITQGIGRMPAFGKRILPEDRWAIVSYVRALQLSQNVSADELTPEERNSIPAPSAN